MVKTLKEWREGGVSDLYKYLGFTYNQTIIVEVDEDLHNFMFECIYPNFMNSYLFQVGEPSSCIGEWDTFTTFVKIQKRYFCIGDQLDLNKNKLSSKIVQTHVQTIRTSINLGVEVKQSAKNLKEFINK